MRDTRRLNFLVQKVAKYNNIMLTSQNTTPHVQFVTCNFRLTDNCEAIFEVPLKLWSHNVHAGRKIPKGIQRSNGSRLKIVGIESDIFVPATVLRGEIFLNKFILQ